MTLSSLEVSYYSLTIVLKACMVRFCVKGKTMRSALSFLWWVRISTDRNQQSLEAFQRNTFTNIWEYLSRYASPQGSSAQLKGFFLSCADVTKEFSLWLHLRCMCTSLFQGDLRPNQSQIRYFLDLRKRTCWACVLALRIWTSAHSWWELVFQALHILELLILDKISL